MTDRFELPAEKIQQLWDEILAKHCFETSVLGMLFFLKEQLSLQGDPFNYYYLSEDLASIGIKRIPRIVQNEKTDSACYHNFYKMKATVWLSRAMPKKDPLGCLVGLDQNGRMAWLKDKIALKLRTDLLPNKRYTKVAKERNPLNAVYVRSRDLSSPGQGFKKK